MRGVRFGDAAQVDLAMRLGRQDDVVGLDASQFLKNRARRIPESRTALPHLKHLPEHEGEEADQDVSLDAMGELMPDRPDVQLIFLDAEGGFRLGELDIGFPELCVGPIRDVGAQHIGAF